MAQASAESAARRPALHVVNLVATAELGQPVNLPRLRGVKGFLYDEAVYRCAYLKDKQTKAKVIVFRTGKMICVGAGDADSARRDLRHAARRLAVLRLIEPTPIKMKIRNIVATADLGHTIDIEKLSSGLPNVIYEPEQFPGAIYYASELGGASVLIFASGKLVFAGLTSNQSLVAAQNVMFDLGKLSLPQNAE